MSPRAAAPLAFAALIAALLFRPSPAFAAPLVLHDTDRFHVTLRDGMRSCLASHDVPADPAACKDVARYPTLPPESAESRSFVVGALWPEDAVAVVTGTLVKMEHPAPEDIPLATEFAKGMSEGAVKQLPGASVHGSPDVRLLDVGGMPVARIAFDLDSVSADKSVTEHNVCYVAASEEGLYALSFATSKADAAALRTIEEDVIATLRVQHPAPAHESLAYSAGYLVGQLLVVVIVIVFAVVVVVRSRRKGRLPPVPGAPPGY
jgi:hypothetical protein